MRNYEAMMQQMTPELLAEKNVHLVTVDNRRLFYLTSSGQLFNNTDLEAAINHEYNWLMFDPEAAQNNDEGGEPDCAQSEAERTKEEN